ncbi:MAG: hypothetical protein U1D67_07370 [Dehalococcoidia bacterium]|nr:hypothetical protein [Dehalococcoidia bacterium]
MAFQQQQIILMEFPVKGLEGVIVPWEKVQNLAAELVVVVVLLEFRLMVVVHFSELVVVDQGAELTLLAQKKLVRQAEHTVHILQVEGGQEVR